MEPDMVIGRRDGAGGAREERRRKAELVQETVRELLEDRRRERQRRDGDGGTEEEDEDGLLSSLLSKVDAMQKNDDLNFHANSEDRQETGNEVKLRDIAKDLNKIKRQNMITHILLGTVIVMTAVWQFNEVSFLLAVKKKLSNPFKSLGELIKGSLKGRGRPMIEAPPLPPVGVPDVTRNDLPLLLISNGNGNDDD
ncbi:uncharacterized protein LOC102720771 [Oryza brachyantha]|uniref:Uncharacterized protein n=1 Tax=Oryza brachyantha TaxID=4533 RepID=J3LD52_ORYBR|nr:uncharacterized protein LOC102720771 [Oryza brachyantha]